MKTWTSALALMIGGAVLAAPAFAQSGGAAGGDGSKKPGMQQPGATGTTPGGTSAPGATGTTGTSAERKGQVAASTAQRVRAAQEVLKDQGMYEGEIDGIMGPKTQAALREFQKKEGLQETGRLDQQTMARLGVDKTGAKDSTSPAASPPSGASPEKKDQPEATRQKDATQPKKDQPDAKK